MNLILLIIIVCIVYAICLSLSRAQSSAMYGSHRSKLETQLIIIVEDITGHPFPQSYPSWLRDGNVQLELDGYNEELRIAIEVQGPGHRAQMSDESYDKYIARIERDKLKQKLCTANNVALITLEYDILSADTYGARNYIISRIYDVAKSRGIYGECPRDYIPEQKIKPWQRSDA